METTLFSLLLSFFVSVLVAPFVIKIMRNLRAGQPILHYVEAHYTKSGTPTIGGVIFIFGVIVSFIFFINGNMRLSTICFASMLGFGLLGFLDDFIKVKYAHNAGLKVYQKALGQLGIATLIAVFAYNSSLVGSGVVLPFTSATIDFGWFIIPFIIFVFLAVTNSVNLIDGLDGLASGVSFFYLIGFIVVLMLKITELENIGESINKIAELKNVLFLSGALAGGLLAFLVFNSYPAKIFMGDTGSLAIGGFISASIVVTRLYLYLPLIGVMFVITAFSDVVQVLYYKATKKRVLLMAPLHHHFEKKNINESKIVSIYIIITILAVVITVGLLI